MNVLIIQENGRHEKNRHFRECFCLQRAFEHLFNLDEYPHNVVVWGLGHNNFNDGNLPDNMEDFDIIINLENYSTDWIPDLSPYPGYKFLWSIDAHVRGTDPFEREFERGKYNRLLHSTKKFVTEDHHVWFPNAYDHNLIYPLSNPKQYIVGFCGNVLNRGPALAALTQRFGLKKDIFKIGHDMVEALNSYHISFNQNIAGDINYRSFETLGCRTVLLTNHDPQYDELGFKHGINCYMYRTIDEALDIVQHALMNLTTNIPMIAEEGYQFARRNHTYVHRAEKLLSVMGNHELKDAFDALGMP